MKKWILFGFCLIFLMSCQRQVASNSVIRPLDWLIGTWEGDYRKGKFVETWVRLNNQTIKGEGDYIVKGNTVMRESLQIHTIDDYIGYIASINGGVPVLFSSKIADSNRWVFENKEHDFPQRIIYEHKVDNKVYIRAEGIMNGKELVDEYTLHRKE